MVNVGTISCKSRINLRPGRCGGAVRRIRGEGLASRRRKFAFPNRTKSAHERFAKSGAAGPAKPGWMSSYLTEQSRERLAKYHLRAARAHASAVAAKSPEARDMFIAVAAAWETLASEIERAEEAQNRR